MRKWSKIAAAAVALCLLIGCNSEPALAVVPDVTEADKDTAIAVLTGQGFVPVVKEFADPTAPVGTVLRIDPPAGSHVAVGGKVYLFVVSDTATTAPPSSTTMPQTSTSATHSSTSLHQTTATASSCAHQYVCGICVTCGKVYPYSGYDSEPLSLGQTWTMKDEWSFTLLGVGTHDYCTTAAADADQRVIILRYTYKNLGFESSFDDLTFDSMTFTVIEDSGAVATACPCPHKKVATPCDEGEFRGAEETYLVATTCRSITLRVTFRTTMGVTRGVYYLLELPELP